MTKKDVSSIERGAGYFLGFITALMNVARHKEVPFKAIYRLGTDDGYSTVEKIVDIALADWQVEQSKSTETQQPQGDRPYRDATTNGGALPKDHYRVRVTYDPIPSMSKLKKEWGEKYVSFIYDGRPFTLHASCQDMDRTPGEKVFYIHDAGGNWESEERIAWGAKQRNVAAPNGYRPATEQETYEFAIAHPELSDFAGPGSCVMNNDHCLYVANVWYFGRGRILDACRFNETWGRKTRVLFVSK